MIKLDDGTILYADLEEVEKLAAKRRNKMEKNITIQGNKGQLKKTLSLLRRIRNTREEWCENVNEELAKINTYKNKTDAEIIIKALEQFLWNEEDELDCLFDHMEDKENDENN